MLNATVSPDVLKAIVAPPTALENDELLYVESDGIEIHATDKSREAIVKVSVSEAAFDSYRAETMECGIELSKVAWFLNLVGSPAQIRINIDAEQGWVTLTGGVVSYTFSLVDSNDVPRVFASFDAEQPAAVTIPGRKLDVPIKLADIAGSHVRLSTDSDLTTFSGITDNLRDTLHFKFGAEDVEEVQGSAVGLPVSLDYFAPIQRVIPPAAQVRFELGNHEHVRLQYPIADGAGSVTVTFAGLAV